MLDFIGRGPRTCDGVSRRTFLKVGALAIGGLSLPGLLRQRAAAQTHVHREGAEQQNMQTHLHAQRKKGRNLSALSI